MRILSQTLSVLVLLLACSAVKSQQWTLSKEKDGIFVYTAQSGSAYKMFKAEMVIDANLHGLIYLIKDARSVPKWMENVSEFELFGETDDFHWLSWTGVDLPWPVDNRDVVSKQEMRKFSNGFCIDITSIPDKIADRDGYIRLRVSEGLWSFEQLPKGKVKVIYQIAAEPTGIPAWVVNLFIVDSPYNTLVNMREMVKEEPYKSVKLSYLH